MGCLETSTHHFPGISRQSWRWFLSAHLTSYFPSIDEFAYGSCHAVTVYSTPCFSLINDRDHGFQCGMGGVGPVAPLSPIYRMRKWGACPRLLVRYPEGGANRQKRPVPSVFALNSDRPRHPAKLPVKPSQTFSAKRRSVAVQHCAFWGVLGGLWLGGKFSHAKSAIEHKRRYAHIKKGVGG